MDADSLNCQQKEIFHELPYKYTMSIPPEANSLWYNSSKLQEQQPITYYFSHQHGWIKVTTVHDSHNFRLKSQCNLHKYIGNNNPVHQSRQSTECTSFAYPNDAGDDIYNQTLRSQHHWQNQHQPTIPCSGTDHNQLLPVTWHCINIIHIIKDGRVLNFILCNHE